MPRSLRQTSQRQVTSFVNWREQLQPASFRNVPFFVFSTSTLFGRRNQIHQYPFKDEPYIEDMGLDTDEFTIEGYILQQPDNDYDYMAGRDKLIAALKEKGAGILIHPFYGSRRVSLVGKVSVEESFNEGGIARFRMHFVKDAESDIPVASKAKPSPIKAVDEEASSFLDNLKDAFGSIFNPDNIPGFSALSSLDAVGSLNKMLIAVTSGIQGAGPSKISQALTILSDQYDAISLTTIGQTCGLGNGIIGMSNGLLSLGSMYGDIVVDQLFGACSSAVRGISSGPFSGASSSKVDTGFMVSSLSGSNLIPNKFGKSIVDQSLEVVRFGEAIDSDDPSSFGGSLDSINITTAARARESANREAIVNLARNMAIYTAVRTAIRVEYDSYEEMSETLTNITEAIQNQLLKIGNDDPSDSYSSYGISITDNYSYIALQALRGTFTESMIRLGVDLSNIIDYEIPATVTPSLVLAYDLYDDLDREQEIINRNIPAIQHPGFIQGGTTIEVLSE